MKDYQFIGTAENIAHYIISSLPQVDNLKLQKLLYYAQAVHLVRTENKEALFENQIQAWQYGPVVPDVYRIYKSHGVEPILVPEHTGDFRVFPEKITKKAMLFAQESIDMMLGYYGEKSGIELIKKTHAESPWQDVFDPAKKNIEISRQSMYDFYKDMFTFYDEET